MVAGPEICCSNMALHTNATLGCGNAASSTHQVWLPMSTSMCVCPRAFGLIGPKRAAARTSKRVPIGRRRQCYGPDNCVSEMHNVHRARKSRTLALKV